MRGRQQHVSCERNRIYMAIFKGTEGRSLSTMEMCAMDLVAAHCVSDASLTQSQIRWYSLSICFLGNFLCPRRRCLQEPDRTIKNGVKEQWICAGRITLAEECPLLLLWPLDSKKPRELGQVRESRRGMRLRTSCGRQRSKNGNENQASKSKEGRQGNALVKQSEAIWSDINMMIRHLESQVGQTGSTNSGLVKIAEGCLIRKLGGRRFIVKSLTFCG